jgi:hypothetical protein
MIRRLLVALVAVTLLAGCGEGAGGEAEVWVTRDRGAQVLHEATVPAGLTAIQGLMRLTDDVGTRYSGTFVHSVDGIDGGEEGDWLYYVNGYWADRSSAEYRLRAGDVEWWDFYRWQDGGEVSVVVGAFPEPFLHGYDGKRRPAAVRYASGLKREAAALGTAIDATSVARIGRPAASRANLLLVVPGPPRAQIAFRVQTGRPGDPVVMTVSGTLARTLARNPAALRFKFSVP